MGDRRIAPSLENEPAIISTCLTKRNADPISILDDCYVMTSNHQNPNFGRIVTSFSETIAELYKIVRKLLEKSPQVSFVSVVAIEVGIRNRNRCWLMDSIPTEI